MRTILSGSVIFFSLRVLPSWRVAEAAAAASEISFTSQDSKIQSFQNYFAAGELEEGEKKLCNQPSPSSSSFCLPGIDSVFQAPRSFYFILQRQRKE